MILVDSSTRDDFTNDSISMVDYARKRERERQMNAWCQ